MCGIYITNLRIGENEVRRRLETIKFRGPDFTGVQKKNSLTLAHLRLSIIDLDERSNQPMNVNDNIIVFNGEIYNFLEIKEELINKGCVFNTTGDTEVLLKGYEVWGEEIVSKLNGMFAFAIYDVKKNILFCSRDRLGVKPFYYSWLDGEFEICSQLKPISYGKKVNNEAISMYLDCTYVPSPFSIYENVFKLPPGHNLIIDLENNTHIVKKYWDLFEVKKTKSSFKQAKNDLHKLIKDAVRIRLKSDVTFGAFLSGGIDSALVSSIASEISLEQLKTFTIGFENKKYDESKIAEEFSKRIKSEHKLTICKPEDFLKMMPILIKVYDEPFGDSSALPSLLLNKITKEHVTVALSGDGGDESFLGYNHFDLLLKYKKIFIIPYFFRKFISFFLGVVSSSSKVNSIRRLLEVKNINNFIEGIFLGYNTLLKDRDVSWLSNYSVYKDGSSLLLQKAADLNIKLWLENDSNVKVDRASMASSVEVRSPFLDYRIVEFARTLPVKYRIYNGKKKYILKEILKEYIPEEIFEQPKKGFSIPIGQWICNELKEEFTKTLSDDFLYSVPNLDVDKFKKMFKDHIDGKAEYSSYIWRVYVLAKWYKEQIVIKN